VNFSRNISLTTPFSRRPTQIVHFFWVQRFAAGCFQKKIIRPDASTTYISRTSLACCFASRETLGSKKNGSQQFTAVACLVARVWTLPLLSLFFPSKMGLNDTMSEKLHSHKQRPAPTLIKFFCSVCLETRELLVHVAALNSPAWCLSLNAKEMVRTSKRNSYRM